MLNFNNNNFLKLNNTKFYFKIIICENLKPSKLDLILWNFKNNLFKLFLNFKTEKKIVGLNFKLEN